MSASLETRLAVLEARVDSSLHEHTAIFARLDSTNSKLDSTNDKLEDVVRRQVKNDVYVKILWPTVTVLASVISFILGYRFF